MRLIIPGRPVPAARMTRNEAKLMKYGRHPTNKALQDKYDRIKRYLDYKDYVAWTAKTNGIPYSEDKLRIEIDIYTNGNVGDWDNYGKSICDALQGIACKNDRQFKGGRVDIWECPGGQERAEITIEGA
jgi:Holliday junction resolvase RusA-like endonuclease